MCHASILMRRQTQNCLDQCYTPRNKVQFALAALAAGADLPRFRLCPTFRFLHQRRYTATLCDLQH
jgi:hypothetical protein